MTIKSQRKVNVSMLCTMIELVVGSPSIRRKVAQLAGELESEKRIEFCEQSVILRRLVVEYRWRCRGTWADSYWVR